MKLIIEVTDKMLENASMILKLSWDDDERQKYIEKALQKSKELDEVSLLDLDILDKETAKTAELQFGCIAIASIINTFEKEVS